MSENSRGLGGWIGVLIILLLVMALLIYVVLPRLENKQKSIKTRITDITLENMKLIKGDSVEISVTVYRDKKYYNDTTFYITK